MFIICASKEELDVISHYNDKILGILLRVAALRVDVSCRG